jgi:hypothetical protein
VKRELAREKLALSSISWADIQRSKFNLEVLACSCFFLVKIQFDLEQEVNIPALVPSIVSGTCTHL